MSKNQLIIDLIQRLQNLNCRIWVEDEKLRIRTSKNSLTPEIKQEIQNHKNEIIAFLQTAKKQAVSTEEIPLLAADAPQPLSFAQQRLWILSQLQESADIYNMPVALQINGELNIDALYASLTYLFNRHQSLRMYFPQVNGEAHIAVHNLGDIKVLNIQEFREFNDKDNSQIQSLINTQIQEKFDLNQGQLFTATLLQFTNYKFVLVMNMHHIISDGWSMGVLMKELWEAYKALNQGEKPNLHPLPIQYSDYAAWQRNRLQGEILNKQINYWQEQLNNAPSLLTLPTDFPRPPVQSFRGNRYIFTLSSELTKAIKTFSQQQNVSLFMTLLATFNILLSRYSRQNDLCIGSPIANRTHSQTEGLIGFFVNTFVLRSQINWRQNFLDLLQQTRQICLNAYAHQDIPFEVVVEKLKPERSMTYNPLFQVMFALENNENLQANIPGLNIEMFAIEGGISKFDLSLLVMEENQQLTCYWEYATDLFTTTTIQTIAEHFHVLIQEIINYPQKPLYTLSGLTVNNINHIKSWNQTQTDYPQDKTFVDLFTQQVEKNPDNLAVVFESHERGRKEKLKTLTYQQLNEKAECLANYLITNYQIQPDTLVGIAVERSLEMIIGVLGILKTGAAYVPIDPNYPPERIKLMLVDAGISVLLTQTFLVDNLPLDRLENPVDVIYLDHNYPQATQHHKTVIKNTLSSDNLAYVIYTSGSTGTPKGVMIEHRGLVNLCLTIREVLEIKSSSRVLQFAAFSFDASVWEIATTLVAGACLYLADKETLLPSQSLLNFLTKNQISHVTLPPSVLSLLPEAILPDLKVLTTAGENCSQELVKKWGKKRKFFNAYGPTESTVCSSISLCFAKYKKPLIGKPIDNIRIYILDEYNQILPPGIPGELCIAGAGLARGYLNLPQLTVEKFIEVELFGKLERIYKTGDLAKWNDDGNLEYLGRIDQQVKLRGFRIELGEIEAVLLQHPLVKEAVVVLHITPNNHQSLIAYVTGSEQDLSTTLKNQLQSRLPDYMIPAQIIILEQFPLTPNGKIDRKNLPAPDFGDCGLYVAPRNDLEQQLAKLWSQVLEIETIGIHDNFFNLGGHSLLAIKLLNILEKEFQYNLPLSSLFQNPTIAKFAATISYQSEQLHPDLLTLKSQGNSQPIFCFPGANGSGFYFQDLAVNLENHPVYSLETPGRNGKQTIPSSVEHHASQLIELLNYQQIQNSYILIGYSSGSAVAFETAYQLETQGKKVDLLAILDAGLVSHPQFLIDRKEIDWIWQLLQRTEALKGVSLGLKYADLVAQPDDQSRWNLAAEYLYKYNVLPEYSSLDLIKTNIQVMKKLTENYANYQPNYQISAPIILFRAQENHDILLQEIRAISNYDLPDWGWQAYTQNSVQIISIPGNHGQMLYLPNVKFLTTQLQMMI